MTSENVHAFLIDWGANIPQDNRELKAEAKISSVKVLRKIFGNYNFMHNYYNNFDYLLSASKNKPE